MSTEEDQEPIVKKNQDPVINFDDFDPIIRSVLRSSNVYRYTGATHFKVVCHLHHAFDEIDYDAHLSFKLC